MKKTIFRSTRLSPDDNAEQKTSAPKHGLPVWLAFAGMFSLAPSAVQAVTLLKDNSTTVSVNAGWTNTVPATSADIALFNNTLSAANALGLTLGSDLALAGMQFASTLSGPVVFSAPEGYVLSLGGTGLVSASATPSLITFNHDVQLTAPQAWTNAMPIVMGGRLTGGGNPDSLLHKNGAGTLFLNASNSFAGKIVVGPSGGKLWLGAAATLANSDIILAGIAWPFSDCLVTNTVDTPSPSQGRGKGLATLQNTVGLLTCVSTATQNVENVFSGPLTLGGRTLIDINTPDALQPTSSSLVFDALEQPASGGSLQVFAPNLGASVTGVTGVASQNIFFKTPPVMIGGGGAKGTKTQSIIPGVHAILKTRYSTTDLGASFCAYDPTNGLRYLSNSEFQEYTNPNGVSNQVNYYLQGQPDLPDQVRRFKVNLTSASTTVNALKLSWCDINGTGTLTVASGSVMNTGESTIGTNTPGTATLVLGDVGVFQSSIPASHVGLYIGNAIVGSKGLNRTGSSAPFHLWGPVDVGGPVRNLTDGPMHIRNTIHGPVEILLGGSLELMAGGAITGALTMCSTSYANLNGTSVGDIVQSNGTVNLNGPTVGAVTLAGGTCYATNGAVMGAVSLSGLSKFYLGADCSYNASALSNNATPSSLYGLFYNRPGDVTLDAALDGVGKVNQQSTAGVLTIRQASGHHAVGGFNLSANTAVILDGEPDAVTDVDATFSAPFTSTFTVRGGTWAFRGGWDAGTWSGKELRLEGGTLTVQTNASFAATFFMYQYSATTKVSIVGGTLRSRPVRGLRFGDYWIANTGTGHGEVLQTGGSVEDVNTSDYTGLGGTRSNITVTYDLAGGRFYANNNFTLCSAKDSTSLASLTLRGTGALTVRNTFKGDYADTGAQQVFAFKGGTLSVYSLLAANLRPARNGERGTLFNEGGTLAPGQIGTAGTTTITGNYAVTSPDGLLAVDIGGTSQANAFTNVPGYYDALAVSKTGTLSGKLCVSLINGFVPGPANTFDVLTAASLLSGSFDNVADGTLWAEDGYSRFAVTVDEANRRVRLSGYASNAWSSATGGAWDDTGVWSIETPDGTNRAAYFGEALAAAGTVVNHAARTLRGLTFDSANAYTVGGGGSLTLAPGGLLLEAPVIAVKQGYHTIAQALSLAHTTSVDVAANAQLTLAGNVTGTALVKTGTGKLVISGPATLNRVSVDAGTLLLSGSISTFGSLNVAAGGVFSFYSTLLTVQDGLTIGTGGAFNFQGYGTGTLRLKKGSAGGGIDTAEEFLAAVADNRVTVKGQAVIDTTVFILSEEEIGGAPYVTVTLKSFGTVLHLN